VDPVINTIKMAKKSLKGRRPGWTEVPKTASGGCQRFGCEAPEKSHEAVKDKLSIAHPQMANLPDIGVPLYI
jgi:hypothetical protein